MWLSSHGQSVLPRPQSVIMKMKREIDSIHTDRDMVHARRVDVKRIGASSVNRVSINECSVNISLHIHIGGRVGWLVHDIRSCADHV